MILMPNDDKPWPIPNEHETSMFQQGGLGELTATVLYGRRIQCSDGPALHFLRWYFGERHATERQKPA